MCVLRVPFQGNDEEEKKLSEQLSCILYILPFLPEKYNKLR